MEPARPYRLGLVGHPVAHSRSPDIHRAALAATGLAGAYELFDAPSVVDLEARLAELRAGALDGLNVTLPHKRDAALRCDTLEGDASTLGVANTLVVRQGRLVGHNTDAEGLARAIEARWPARAWSGRAVLVLGAGGAAYAAVLAARRLGLAEVRVWNRTRARADELAQALGQARVSVFDDAREGAAGVALIVQAGSGDMGLAPESDAWEQAVVRALPIVSGSAPDAALVDLVYKPRRTTWVEAATRAGRDADDGLAMLVHQARLAFTLWTGREPPLEPLLRALEG
ncbi:MAG: shikimate dehydrogenase [Deltaproteobacteria bacterium]|nr:shikimate dehydrogenase [Deltaproteobacteria bacterium]